MIKTLSSLLKRPLNFRSKLQRYKLLRFEKSPPSPLLTAYLIKNQFFKKEPFSLIDVGASGGISPFWSIFQNQFSAIGFDPLLDECERLNSEKSKPNSVSYHSYFIISDDPDVVRASGPSDPNSFYGRASHTKYNQIKHYNYIQELYNQGKEATYTDKKTSLDHYFSNHPIDAVDFIKVDTDGHDYAVLHGAQKLLKEKDVLGIKVECQLHGELHHHSNTFRNIDRLLTEAGFHFFDISLYRYSRGKLPNLFSLPIPAQTLRGQMLWGDAIYFRDYVRSESEAFGISVHKLLKLACLYELFGVSDCAAELILNFKDKLQSHIDIEHCLNLLVKGMGFNLSYQDYIRRFETTPHDFFPPSYKIINQL